MILRENETTRRLSQRQATTQISPSRASRVDSNLTRQLLLKKTSCCLCTSKHINISTARVLTSSWRA